jgi:hypothetical protein
VPAAAAAATTRWRTLPMRAVQSRGYRVMQADISPCGRWGVVMSRHAVRSKLYSDIWLIHAEMGHPHSGAAASCVRLQSCVAHLQCKVDFCPRLGCSSHCISYWVEQGLFIGPTSIPECSQAASPATCLTRKSVDARLLLSGLLSLAPGPCQSSYAQRFCQTPAPLCCQHLLGGWVEDQCIAPGRRQPARLIQVWDDVDLNTVATRDNMQQCGWLQLLFVAYPLHVPATCSI